MRLGFIDEELHVYQSSAVNHILLKGCACVEDWIDDEVPEFTAVELVSSNFLTPSRSQ